MCYVRVAERLKKSRRSGKNSAARKILDCFAMLAMTTFVILAAFVVRKIYEQNEFANFYL